LIIGIAKVSISLFWVAWILALLSLLPDSWNQPIVWIGVALLVIHFGEYLFLRAKVAALQEGNSGFVGFMLFGFAYWLPVLKQK
jgi:uncharacterized protein YhhL (DUF1145 family)